MTSSNLLETSLIGWLLLGAAACASGEDRVPVDPADPPPNAAPAAPPPQPSQGHSGVGDSAKPPLPQAGVERALAARVPELSLELIAALVASSAVSDQAAAEYTRKVEALRTLPKEHCGRLRLALANLPGREHTLRQRMVQLLGDIAAEREDAELLERYAAAPLATPDSVQGTAHEKMLELDEQPTTSWLATFALSRMARRGSSDARQALSRLLSFADRDVATSAAIEIYGQDGLTEGEKQQLKARNIPTRFEPAPESESRLEVEDLPALAERVKRRGLVPPPASH